MKTSMNQLKFGTLLTGFILISSCTGNATINSEKAIASTLNASTALYIGLTSNKSSASLNKPAVRPNQFVTTFPISFGISETTLVSN